VVLALVVRIVLAAKDKNAPAVKPPE